jgi:hypothetical protein
MKGILRSAVSAFAGLGLVTSLTLSAAAQQPRVLKMQ